VNVRKTIIEKQEVYCFPWGCCKAPQVIPLTSHGLTLFANVQTSGLNSSGRSENASSLRIGLHSSILRVLLLYPSLQPIYSGNMPRAAPSREAPSATNDQEAGVVLKLGEYTEEPTLNTSEARMIILKTLETRKKLGANTDETETLVKTKDYLEIFAVFKELQEAQQVEGIINVYGSRLEKFEKSQIGA
jgi:hypothetical protein